MERVEIRYKAQEHDVDVEIVALDHEPDRAGLDPAKIYLWYRLMGVGRSHTSSVAKANAAKLVNQYCGHYGQRESMAATVRETLEGLNVTVSPIETDR